MQYFTEVEVVYIEEGAVSFLEAGPSSHRGAFPSEEGAYACLAGPSCPEEDL